MPGYTKLIGPRMASGAFYKMRGGPKYRDPCAATKKRKYTKGKPKTVAQVVKRVLNRQLETKYVSQNMGGTGLKVPSAIITNANAIVILPDVAIQTSTAQSNLREGDQIEPIKARVRGHIWFNPVPDDIPNQEYTKILYVKMFIVQSKQIKFVGQVAQLDAGLLENGTADPVTWVSSALDFQAFYPVAKQNYTLLKTRTMKFVKNYGKTQGDITSGVQPNIGMDRKTFSYSWKPPTLKYGDENKVQPTNHFPIMYLVAYSPGIDVGTTDWLNGALLYNFHREMYYKDA